LPSRVQLSKSPGIVLKARKHDLLKPLQSRSVFPLFLFLIVCSNLAAQAHGAGALAQVVSVPAFPTSEQESELRASEPRASELQAPELQAPELQASASALPDAPQANPDAQAGGNTLAATPAAGYHPHRYAEIIDPEWATNVLTPGQKMIFALREDIRWITLIPALYAAGYEQLADSPPRYGTDSRAGASKFGAAMARSGSVRFFSDGVFAPAFHQDPRYYRMAHGSILRRTAYAAERALIRRGDDGSNEFNYSGVAGRAASAVLTLAYYPPVSRNRGVVLRTFGVSILTDAGGNWIFEFFPDVVRKFTFLKKVEIE
jgi:hypothetical protein